MVAKKAKKSIKIFVKYSRMTNEPQMIVSGFSSEGGQIISTAEGEAKMNTCVHRSKTQQEHVEIACCGKSSKKMFFACEKLGIEKLTSAFCDGCQLFEEVREE